MSSSGTGVQAHIKKHAPDAEFQGCCLHSLNLAICHSSQIQAVRNMIDSCQQAFLYFHNSPKRQRFLEHIISCLCPSASKNKINGLCKTRWVERQHIHSYTRALSLPCKDMGSNLLPVMTAKFILMETTESGIQNHVILRMD